MKPPLLVCGRGVAQTIQVHLDAGDYRKLYELVLIDGGSMADTVRRMVREEFQRKEGFQEIGDKVD